MQITVDCLKLNSLHFASFLSSFSPLAMGSLILKFAPAVADGIFSRSKTCFFLAAHESVADVY
jgi:hypothetical protein